MNLKRRGFLKGLLVGIAGLFVCKKAKSSEPSEKLSNLEVGHFPFLSITTCSHSPEIMTDGRVSYISDGKIRFRKGTTLGQRLQELRAWLPPVRNGFQRITVSVNGDSYDHTVSWKVVDEEIRS